MEDLTGKQLGQYRVVEPLGEGGMAAVYKAYQPAMDRYVALKILPRHFASDPEFVGRFQQEAKVIAKLQHVYILPVHDFGEAEGYTYIVMPYVRTGTLADLLEGKPLPLAKIQKFSSQVGAALGYAHSKDIVHRDVKPSNILIDERENCLLTDFGIAKMVEGTSHFTQTGATIGTPAYMAPEQILGEKLDGRSDIYSLGIVLFEMATGRQPYRAETPPAIFVKHLHDPLPLPRTENPDLPESVERVILKSLAKDREDRYPSAADFVQAITAAISEKPREEVTVVEPEVVPVPTVVEDEVPEVKPSTPLPREPITPEIERVEAIPSRKVPTWLYGLVAIALVVLFGIFLGPRLFPGGVEETPVPTIPPATLEPATAVPTMEPESIGVSVKWIFNAPSVIYYLDSWGDGMASGDLNQDDVPDVAFGTKGGDVIVVNGATGTELWSYRVTTQMDAPVNVDIVDVNDDGTLEVIAAGKGDSTTDDQAIIIAFDRSGTYLWQALGIYEEVTDFGYGDVNNDGNTDVIAGVGTYPWGGGELMVMDGATGSHYGSEGLGSGTPQGLDIGDVDGDGYLDAVIETYDNKVFLLDGFLGELLWEREKSWYGRDVVISDVDDDGTREVISGAGQIVVFDPSGNQEWMADVEEEGMDISVADVTGDGRLNIILSSGFSGVSAVFDGDGQTLWERQRSGVHVIGDVNGDGTDDIVFATISYYGIELPYSIEAVDGENNTLWSYPLDSIFNEHGFAMITVDLDGDPAQEMLVANGTQLLALDVVRAGEEVEEVTLPTPVPQTAYDFAFVSIQNDEYRLYISSSSDMTLAREIPLPAGYEFVRWPSWCGDRLYIEVADADRIQPQRIYIVDPFMGTEEMWQPTDPGFGNLATPGCTSDGSSLAYAAYRDGRYQLEVSDLLNNRRTFTTSSIADVHFGNPTWSSDAGELFFMGFLEDMYSLWRVSTGTGRGPNELSLLNTVDGGTIYESLYPSLSPDGLRVVFICSMDDWRLCVHDLTTWQTQWLHKISASYIEGTLSSPGTPSWSPDGVWILFATEDDGDRDIYRIRPDGSGLENLTIDWPGTELMPAWRR
ncbi:MAG: protein kinase [Anaerolineaceae bacterium]|nr:MAG: protein kinase [Anaerolineaceae bacterium]